MSNPSDPSYQITLSQPSSDVIAGHPFVQLVLPNYCGHEVLRLESGWPVICGLPRANHRPAPNHPPDEARDT